MQSLSQCSTQPGAVEGRDPNGTQAEVCDARMEPCRSRDKEVIRHKV